MPYLEAASSKPRSLRYMDLEESKYLLKDADFHQTVLVMSQWAIFAIRNLLEKNTQNQELVAALERRGAADYSALRELGFLVEEIDGNVLLKTVRKDS